MSIASPRGITPITTFTGEHRFLSNFFPAPVSTLGQVWPTAEHAYQACKSIDPEYRSVIMAAETPGIAKRLGQGAQLRQDWEDVKVAAMASIVMAKFSQNAELLQLLAQTGADVLIEGNAWHDQFWGACGCGRPACAPPGKNVMGWLLMTARSALC